MARSLCFSTNALIRDSQLAAGGMIKLDLWPFRRICGLILTFRCTSSIPRSHNFWRIWKRIGCWRNDRCFLGWGRWLVHVGWRSRQLFWNALNFLPLVRYLNFFIINYHIDWIHHSFYSFVKNLVSTTVGGASQEYSFITFGIKFSQIISVSKNITFTSKDLEVLNCGFLSSPYLIRSLVGFWPQIDSIDDVASSVDSFSPKVLS
jgi:hypothetical protein